MLSCRNMLSAAGISGIHKIIGNTRRFAVSVAALVSSLKYFLFYQACAPNRGMTYNWRPEPPAGRAARPP